MADNKMNDETSFQQAELPTLCAKGCGFFGTAAMMNMCSKCYRDHRLTTEQTAAVKSAVEKSLLPPSPPRMTLVVPDTEKSKSIESSSSETVTEKAAEEPEQKPKAKNRCGSCNKKVGVLGFECRCGNTFCGSHRYPEEHSCTFDFMEVGKKAIEKANPVIKADKLDRV